MATRILVTGVTGFAGSHLAEALVARPHVEVIGASRHAAWASSTEHLAGSVALHACDLASGAAVESLLRQVEPEQIYHLAGYAHAGQSLQEPEAAWLGNLGVTRTLYEAVMRWGGRPRILFVGSGLVYGDPQASDQTYDESSPLRPSSPYAASKAAADLASYQYARWPGLDIVRVRPFNHIGPRQSSQYAVAHFARQVAAIDRGRQAPVLQTGNLSPVRDLTDVRDVVRAYILLMDRGRTAEAYNVATGQGHSMQAIVERLIAMANVPVEVRQRPDLVRAKDTAVVRGDYRKLRAETGWEPHIPLEQTLRDTLDFWRRQP